jgi:hypothetical protein
MVFIDYFSLSLQIGSLSFRIARLLLKIIDYHYIYRLSQFIILYLFNRDGRYKINPDYHSFSDFQIIIETGAVSKILRTGLFHIYI